MKTLVLGASGATGRLVAAQLSDRNIPVRILIRDSAVIADRIAQDRNIEIVRGDIDGLDTERMRKLITDCDAIVCCLGHNITFKGIFGRPRKLVADAVQKITAAMAASDKTRKFVLMSTTAYENRQLGERNTFLEKLIFSALKLLLPPHRDNVLAGDHLVYEVGASDRVKWVAVRPDSLFDQDRVSAYEIHGTRKRSPIFNPGRTSRINIARFMVELLVDEGLWKDWMYKTPVVYNQGSAADEQQ